MQRAATASPGEGSGTGSFGGLKDVYGSAMITRVAGSEVTA
jgi:hypothetical protein